MASIQPLEARPKTGGPVIPDGANGTESERPGVRMDQAIRCARALADCPDMVHQVHRRYINAGADVITINSFSVIREAMQRHGPATHFEGRNRRIVAAGVLAGLVFLAPAEPVRLAAAAGCKNWNTQPFS